MPEGGWSLRECLPAAVQARPDLLRLVHRQMGRFKRQRLGKAYALDAVAPPSGELAEQVCGIVRAEGLKAN